MVTKLKEAGAVILAKTAMCDFAAGWFSSSSMTDHTKNPYDLERDSGGSSAGTAAGVAANFGLVGIGEDTGGSIRIPASFNNLFGLRVTTGLISRAGSRRSCTSRTPRVRSPGRSPMSRRCWTASSATTRRTPSPSPRRRPALGGYARALDTTSPSASWRIGVLETGFGSDGNPDAEPVNRWFERPSPASRAGRIHDPRARDRRPPGWISDTSVYVQQSRADIDGFLANRADAPVSSFMEIYEAGSSTR